jgi:hypothetical protein
MRRAVYLLIAAGALSATAAQPALGAVWSPDHADFGSQAVGQQSATTTFTLTQPVGFASAEVTTTSADFVVVSENCPDVLMGPMSCQVGVVFAPKAAGPRSGQLYGHGPTMQPAAALTGTGLAPPAAPGTKRRKCGKAKKKSAGARAAKKKCKKKK